MAILSVVHNQDNFIALHSTQPSKNAHFSIFELDGSGSGDPFDYGSSTWTAVKKIRGIEYDADDSLNDSFWEAQQALLKQCIHLGFVSPNSIETW